MIKLLRALDRVATPWKNGGGVTREVVVSPSGTGLDDFDWRVSIADVREVGPFSLFGGIDRTLTILRGRLALRLEDRSTELSEDSAPFAFPGDVLCEGLPVGGPVMDLNVMVRRGRSAARVRRLAGETSRTIRTTTVLFACGPASAQYDNALLPLQSFDAILFDAQDELQLSLQGPAVLIEIV